MTYFRFETLGYFRRKETFCVDTVQGNFECRRVSSDRNLCILHISSQDHLVTDLQALIILTSFGRLLPYGAPKALSLS